MPIERNPFIVGGPVPSERFIGRRRYIAATMDNLSVRGSVAIDGGFRIGKTSLLDYICSSKVAREWELSCEQCTLVRVYCAGIEPLSVPSFWQFVIRELERVAPESIRSVLEQRHNLGEGYTPDFLELFRKVSKARHHPILLLDEFDIIHGYAKTGGSRLLRMLQALMGERLITLVLATARPLQEIVEGIEFQGQPFPNPFMPLTLEAFERQECDELIELALRDSSIQFDDDDRDYVYEVSKGHPYWLQFACFLLFQEKLSAGSSRLTVVTTSRSPVTNQEKLTTQPTVFISYSHDDEKEKNQLLSQLGVLQRASLVGLWSDDQAAAGADWEAEISQAIAQAKVAVLLISANFLTSDFILSKEVPTLLQRREREGLIVFPVIAKDCAWQEVDWLTKMNVRPKNGKPVWSDAGSHVDEDLATIAKEVADIIRRERLI